MAGHTEGLNTAQQEAVLTTDGPLLVLAGAGAGKTRVIAHRILEIVRRGSAPEHILAITFTNKAAAEMRERVRGLLPAGEPPPFVSTFHSLGLQLIKENFRLLGYTRRPTIYDRADSLREMKQALKTVGTEEIEARMALGIVSHRKGEGITAQEFAESVDNGRDRHIAAAWLLYEQALHKDQALDFDDLLLCAVQLLEKRSDVRAQCQTRWTYLHIDEYQDTNHVQARLAELLVGPKKNICAVGDIDQTIYGWRGAQIENIIHFERMYPGAKVVILEQNYRSTQKILDAANTVIAKNPNRPEKNLFTKNGEGESLSLYMAFDETDEAAFVARRTQELIAEGAHPRDIAVLYRANFQSRAIEEQLLAADVPYQVLGTRFFERKEVKDALSFLRAAVDESATDLGRAIEMWPGIGKTTRLKILMGREQELTGVLHERVQHFRSALARTRAATEKLKPSELVRFVIGESGLERQLKEEKFEGTERLENLRELVTLAARYDTFLVPEGLEQFLESAALASDQDEMKEEQNAVRLMTVHASKGLEFPYVFITGLEEGLFPYERQDESTADGEEERRLMYVAITRAEKKVFLTYASYRTVFGSKTATVPSQFLSDIPPYLVELETPERLGKTIYLD